jgi:phosphoglycolate phosphatase
MLNIAENINAIIFDFDYTLVDSSSAGIECISYALKQMKLPMPSMESIKQTIGMSIEDTLKALCQVDDPAATSEFRRLFVHRADEVMLERIAFLSGAKQVLIDLHRRKFGLAIVSNRYRYRIEAFLSRENVKWAIDVVVGFEDAPKPKPDPAALLLAVHKLGRTHQQTVYIGDNRVDAEIAQRIHVPFIAVLTGIARKEDFVNYAPICIIDNLQELAHCLPEQTPTE